MAKQAVSCIILAGGEGKRFNREDKGLVTFKDKPLIEHIINRITPQVDDIVISANRNINEYKKYSQKVIGDKAGGFQGPLTGITTCIPECNHEWILVIPCDIPVLPDNLVEQLSNTSSKLIVAKAHEQRQLVFLMHASLKYNLDDFLQQGHQKAMSWIELQKPEVVVFEDEAAMFSNINTPDELNSL